MGDKDHKSKISRSGTSMENFSLDASRNSQDFLTRFMGSGWREGKEEGYDDDEDEKIELNLGLSLGGQFGVDKRSTKLLRASSIAECSPFMKNEDDGLTVSSPSVSYSTLVRTTSLPLETEERRKRKELQSLKRMEAKRRRSEKQRNLRGEKEEEDSSEKKLNLRNTLEKDKLLAAPNLFNSLVAPPLGSSTSAIKGELGFSIANKGKDNHEFRQLLSQGSIESQAGSSSSELDNRSSLQGTRSCGDTSQLLQERNNQEMGYSSTESLVRTSSMGVQNPQNQSNMIRNQVKKEARTSSIEDMPCVFIKGDGPNGRRVDGILYKFGKGEDVCIMCVCHGNFHSPAGFIKHAGGTDVTHPLKHIVMNPNSTPYS